MVDKKTGRIQKGEHHSPKTEFKKGQHWRPRQKWWDKKWLKEQYVTKKKSAQEIASQYNATGANIRYWLDKHNIRTRTTAEARKAKKNWGVLRGKDNPMFGKCGKLNPNWQGGLSPERQSMYARAMWKEIKKLVLKRDDYKCQICYSKKKLIVHHVFPWARYKAFRFTESNLTTLCMACHKKIHAKRR